MVDLVEGIKGIAHKKKTKIPERGQKLREMTFKYSNLMKNKI